MIAVENRVGRLVEVRFAAPVTDADIAGFASLRGRALEQTSERVVCLDVTRMNVLAPEQSERLLDALRGPSPGRLRSAFLLPAARAVVALQFERLIRESQRATTRGFNDRAALEAWLGELLTIAERARLSQFLDEKS
jgi:hypothetical protein